MTASPPDHKRGSDARLLVHQLLSLAACALGGALFAWLRIPLPWMLGALFTMAALRIGAQRGAMPRNGRFVGQWIVGTALGLQFTPHVVRAVAERGGWLLLVAASAPLLALVGSSLLRRWCGLDRGTAWFASMPGGAMEMSVLAERAGARVDRVAMAQSVRVLVVVVTLPPLFALLGVHGGDLWHASGTLLGWPVMAALLAVNALLAAVLAGIGTPNAWVLAPLFGAAFAAGGGLLDGRLPVPIVDLAQVLIGMTLGMRFDRAMLTGAPRFLAAVALTNYVSLGLCGLQAWAIAALSGIATPTLVLAGAPGGISEMALTAGVLGLGTPLVVAAHVLRMVLVLLSAGPMYSRWIAARG